MNLFDNIFKNPADTFMSGITPSVKKEPSLIGKVLNVQNRVVPSKNLQPVQQEQQAQPQVAKKPMTLFSDENEMYKKMKADNLPDETAYSMLKKRRSDLLGGNSIITPEEQTMLLKMQADNISAKQAIAMIQKRRADKEGKIQDMHPTEGVGEQTAKAIPRAIGDVATQAWQGIGKGVEGATNLIFRSVNDLNNITGSSDYSQELANQLPQGGYVSDVAKLGAGTTGSIFNLAKAPLALGINTANQLPGTQYITQGIGKGIQYGSENIGANLGLDKETSMDIATTGMNVLGMKPGINTSQYVNNIRSAYAGAERPGAIFNRGVVPAAIEAVKAPGEALVQTVKMPYDIAKGTIQGGKSIVRNIQPTIASASDAIQTGINRMTKGEINKFQSEQGVSPGKYLNDRNIVSSGKPIEETLLDQMKTSRDQATAGMAAIQGNYKMPTRTFGDTKIDYLREMLVDNYTKAKNTLDAEGATQAKQLLNKYNSEGLTMTEINQSKRKMAENNPVNWLTDSASDRVQTVKKISDEVRNWQFKQAEKAGFTNLKEINKQTQAFYKLHEGITKWNDGIEANNKISLTDYLAFDADPSVFVAKKVLSSPYVRQSIVKGLNKISGRVVKPIEKATIGDINTKRAEYDFGNRNSDSGDRVDSRKQLRIEAPTGKASGAKYVRVNQPKEEAPFEIIKGEVKRPGTTKKQPKQPQRLLSSGTAKNKDGETIILNPSKKSEALNTPDITSNSKIVRPGINTKKVTTPTNESKVSNTKPSTNSNSDIPDGYTTNAFGEVIKKPSNSKGGFIKIPEIGKKEGIKRMNPFGNNPYKSGDFAPLKDLDSDALFRAIGTKDWENIPKQVTLYRGIKSNKDFELFSGDFLTKNKKIAENFAGKEGKVKAFKVNTEDLQGSDFGYEEVIYKPKSIPVKNPLVEEASGPKKLSSKNGIDYKIDEIKKPRQLSAFKDGKIVGKLYLSSDKVNGKPYLHIDGVEVNKDMRGQGIGTEILRNAIEGLKKSDFKGIIARYDTIANKKEIPYIFKKLGFKDKGQGVGLGVDF